MKRIALLFAVPLLAAFDIMPAQWFAQPLSPEELYISPIDMIVDTKSFTVYPAGCLSESSNLSVSLVVNGEVSATCVIDSKTGKVKRTREGNANCDNEMTQVKQGDKFIFILEGVVVHKVCRPMVKIYPGVK